MTAQTSDGTDTPPQDEGARGPTHARTRLQPLVRALHVLRFLGKTNTGATLQELSHALDVPTASMHRLLTVLQDEGFIAKSTTNRRYFLGSTALDLFSHREPGASGLTRPHPELRLLAAGTGETVFVTELQGNRAVCVSLVDGTHPLRLSVRVGEEMPLHAAASARVLLAGLDDPTATMLLSNRQLTAFTRDTPRTIDEVLQHLTRVRTRGFDVCDNELDQGVWAVSAPVHRADGTVCASVTLAAPKQRISTAWDEARASDAVIATADRVAADIGWSPAQPDDPPRSHSH